MAKHDPLIDDKLDSEGWDTLRPAFLQMHEALLGADEAASSKAETIYVKYRLEDDVFGNVFAVIWIKTTKRLTAGLALPDNFEHPLLGPPPPRMHYPPLNRFLALEPGDPIPHEFAEWAKAAYEHASDLKAKGG